MTEQERFEAFNRYRQAGIRYRLTRRVATEANIRTDERDEAARALELARAEYVTQFCTMVGHGLIQGAEGGLFCLLRDCE